MRKRRRRNHRLSKRGSKRAFRNSAKRIHKKNLFKNHSRGGYSL